MRIPRIIWILLLSTIVGVEGIALFNDIPGDTLSDFVWDILSAAPWLIIPLTIFMGWLTWHFIEPTVRNKEDE